MNMQNSRYLIPARFLSNCIEVKRSRFIASVAHTPSREQSRKFVEQISTQYRDANHNCWACVIGRPGSTDQAGMSDDGEPQGSAGKPMLTALLHANIGDITVVVSRYFGGIKLGKGGMARAYTDALLHALEELPLQELINYQKMEIALEYHLLDMVENLLPTYEAQVDTRDFGAKVTLHLRVPAEHTSNLSRHLTEISHGTIAITPG